MVLFFDQTLTAKELDRRGARLLAALDHVLARRRMAPAELRAWQEERLRELLLRAHSEIPFYRGIYQRAGFQPVQFRGLDDLSRIPIVTKDDLRRAARQDLAPAGGFSAARHLMTSGSTGAPIGLFRSEASLYDFTAYAMLLFHDWCAGRPLARALFILDAKPHNIDYALADLLRTTVMEDRILSTFANTARLAEALEQWEPDYISSYPATLRNLAAFLTGRNLRHPGVKLLHLTSEMLDVHTRRLIGRAFPNAVIRETYTSTEAGLMGFQCAEGGGFHLAEDCVLCEIAAGDGPSAAGPGPLTVTDLLNDATPVIRYSGLGDLAVASPGPCPCGSRFSKIAGLQGRFVDSIRLQDGTLLSPYALTNIVASLDGIAAYQIVQHSMRQIEVRIVADAAADLSQADTARRVRAGFAGTVGTGVDCQVTFVDRIPPPVGGHKVPLVVSQLREM